MNDKRSALILARAWCEANGHTFDDCLFDDQHIEHAHLALAALRADGFSIVRTEDWENARALIDPDGDWE